MSQVDVVTDRTIAHPSRSSSIFHHAASGRDRRPRRQYYAKFVYWVRKTHSWIGLWGALLGLVFGLSGIWLNHRAVMKLPPMAQHRGTVQLALPSPPPATSDEMAQWLMRALERSDPPENVRVEAARPAPWVMKDTRPVTDSLADSSQPVRQPHMQPARWLFHFGGPSERVQAEYWQGNQSVTVSTISNGFLATITNLHKGVGMSVPWILLVDTVAGSMIFLSISGVILWIQLNKRRAIGFGILMVSVATSLVLIGARL
jgi:hypothetical protein